MVPGTFRLGSLRSQAFEERGGDDPPCYGRVKVVVILNGERGRTVRTRPEAWMMDNGVQRQGPLSTLRDGARRQRVRGRGKPPNTTRLATSEIS
jgi:hypothetical protein